MAERKSSPVPLELKMTAQLLLDAEQKIEKLQKQIDEIDKAGVPKPALKIDGAIPAHPQVMQRQQLLTEQQALKFKTLAIVDAIHNAAKGQTQQEIARLKNEWDVDMQPNKEGENQALRKQIRDIGRLRNQVWQSVKTAEEPQTDFQKNAFDTTGKTTSLRVEQLPTNLQENAFDTTNKYASLMDRARGLQKEYSYLDEKTNQDQTKEGQKQDTPSEPGIEPEEP